MARDERVLMASCHVRAKRGGADFRAVGSEIIEISNGFWRGPRAPPNKEGFPAFIVPRHPASMMKASRGGAGASY